MNRFLKELNVIPAVAWIVTAVLCGAVPIALSAIFLPGFHDAHFAAVAILLGPSLLIAIFVPLIGYVYGDARRRGMRYVVWTLLAIFIPNGLGILLYFLLREPVKCPCPSCGAGSAFNYCPVCGTAVGRVCPQCHRPAEAVWRNCAHCGCTLATESSEPLPSA